MTRKPEDERSCRRRWSRHAAVAVAAASLALLTGCESFRSAFKIQEIDPDQSIAQSANFRNIYTRNRNIYNKKTRQTDNANGEKIICPEPSPDAMAVAASSFAASVGIAGKGGGSVGSSSAEAAMSLFARSQAIQAVRDTVTAACLAYQNGVLPRFGYQMMMASYPTLLLNAMAIEGVTGGPLHQPGGVAAGVPSISAKAEDGSTSIEIKGSDAKFSGGQKSPKREVISAADAIEAVAKMAKGGISLRATIQTACLMRLGDGEEKKIKIDPDAKPAKKPSPQEITANQFKNNLDNYCQYALNRELASLHDETRKNLDKINKVLEDFPKETIDKINERLAKTESGLKDLKGKLPTPDAELKRMVGETLIQLYGAPKKEKKK